MNRGGHQVAGFVAGVGYGMTQGWWWPQAIAAGVIATFPAGGPTSPDMDQYAWFRRLTPPITPFEHRRITHWWGIPAAAAVLLLVAIHHRPTAGPVAWVGWAAVIGWSSHLATDWVFGAGGYGIPAGIPLMPWWHHVSAARGRIHSDGLAARLAASGLTAVAVVQVAAIAWAAIA